MGVRLHYARRYEVVWEGGWFNYREEQLEDYLREMEEKYLSDNRETPLLLTLESGEWQIHRPALETLLTLMAPECRGSKEIIPELNYEKGMVFDILTEMVNTVEGRPEYIICQWF